MYSWINWHIPPPSCCGPQDTILTDINQLNFNWSKFPYSQHKAFKWSSISKTNLFSSQKGEPVSFQFMDPLNLSTSSFNTTRIMWNGCTLERCTLPAFHWFKDHICKWVPEFESLGIKVIAVLWNNNTNIYLRSQFLFDYFLQCLEKSFSQQDSLFVYVCSW